MRVVLEWISVNAREMVMKVRNANGVDRRQTPEAWILDCVHAAANVASFQAHISNHTNTLH